MSLKPIDLQTNILQMNNAAKEVFKGKDTSLQQQQFAASLVEKESHDKDNKISQVDKVESLIAPLENEFKDHRSRQEKDRRKSEHGHEQGEEEKKELSFFDDPVKGRLIDIKE